MFLGVEPRWFALQVRRRLERTVASILSQKGYETLCPVYRNPRSRGSGEALLLPGYVLIRFDPGVGSSIVRTPAVVRIVGTSDGPIAIPTEQIEGFKRVISSGLPVEPADCFMNGTAVTIQSGPLRDLRGIVVCVRKHHRLLLSLTILRRAVSVELDSSCVMAADPPPPNARAIAPSAGAMRA